VHVIDTSARSKVRGSSTPGAGDLAYVIVADTLESRIEVCLAALKSYSLGVLVARNGDEALGLIRRFGAPVLLIVDLSLPGPDGLAVIDAACHAGGRTGIVAWSTIRGLREFAANQLRGDHVRVLRGSTAPGVVQRAIVRVLGSREVNDTTTLRAERIEEAMGALAAKARSICRTAGAAVYLKPPDEGEFRTAIKWDSDEAIPQLQAEMPRVFDWILKTGDALVLPDLPRQRKGTPTLRLRDLRGLIAVPIVSTEQQTIGILLVFDVRPFKFDSADIDGLKALGRGVSAASSSPAVEGALPRPRDVGSISAQVEPAAAAPPLSTPGSSAAVALLDRRDGNLAIARELARVRREQRSLSVILFGVDSMSAVTAETLRESHGDLVATVAETLTGAVRGSDLAIRWSREELLVVLAGLNADEARRVAERVRAAMQAGARYPIAVSGGVAELLAEDTFESVMARANEQARLAKARGHNRVS
jgi:diguanylate cyclase (GGDEF)-like protein